MKAKPAVDQDLDSITSGPPSSIGLNRAAERVDSWQTFVHGFEKDSDHLTASLVVCHGDWSCVLTTLRVANVGDGWFAATEKSDYIQAIGLSSAKFQHSPSILRPIAHVFRIASSRSFL